ncbi:MAG TPA: hypothetical protein VNV36_06100 [Pseudomonas sp.]|uniref:hypothetical protein n=1 Tax=Pseudomonas sp. TaxID=306 RepID=UPI002CC614FE|nr:hypothetical protein [Pseudomonas sp.]HWH86329.1 hypothetical protein [Pseudomonas sp.]
MNKQKYMKGKAVVSLVSILLSVALLYSNASVHQFAFYVVLVLNIIAWVFALLGGISDLAAANIRKGFWVTLGTAGFSIVALIITGHLALAASVSALQALCWILAFNQTEVKA